MNRYKVVFVIFLILLFFSACNNSQKSAVKELEIQELDVKPITDIDTADVFNLLVSNLNMRLNVISDSMKEIARNQEALEVLVKDEGDYNSLFDMKKDRDEIIGRLIGESMVENSYIQRMYFLSQDGELIMDSNTSNSGIIEIRQNDSEGFETIAYLNENDDVVIFQALLRYMPTGEHIHVVYEVAKEYLLVDIYQTEQSLSDKYCIEVLDVDGNNLLDTYDTDGFKEIHSMTISYNWKISMLVTADE